MWCPVEVPQPQGSPTGLSWALGCKFHGELYREVPACGKYSHKAQEVTLLSEDVTSLSWECQCLFFFFLTGRKKKIIMKLMQISEAALALQLKGCSGGVKAASFPCVGKGHMLPCSRAQAFPQRRQNLSLSTEIPSVVEVAEVLHSLILIPAKQIAGLIVGW